MGDGDGDPSITRVVVPVHAIELGDDVRLVPDDEIGLDGTRVAASSEEDEATVTIGTQLAEVDVDGLVCGALELTVELDWLRVGLVAHDGLRAGVNDEFLPGL